VLGLKDQMNVKEVLKMAKCSICNKGAHFGNAVSHSNRKTNKMWKSNVKSVRVQVNGATKKMYVCTSCLRSGLVERA
jgi:large subunit ribosomal protein L28